MTNTFSIYGPGNLGIDLEALKLLPELMSEMTAKLAEFQKKFYQVIQEHERELPHLLSLMLSYSWYPDFHIPVADSRSLEKCAIVGDFTSIESFLTDYFRQNAAQTERRICKHYPKRAAVISDAFSAYREGRYVLAIPVFLAQADGISEELLSEHFFTSRKSIAEAQRIALNGQLNGYERLLFDPLIHSGTIRDHTATLAGKTGYLNRHAIMHGIDQNYGTEINALKCISLLAYFLMIRTIAS